MKLGRQRGGGGFGRSWGRSIRLKHIELNSQGVTKNSVLKIKSTRRNKSKYLGKGPGSTISSLIYISFSWIMRSVYELEERLLLSLAIQQGSQIFQRLRRWVRLLPSMPCPERLAFICFLIFSCNINQQHADSNSNSKGKSLFAHNLLSISICCLCFY